ncbi:hypothetical protein F5Y10DRAFT_293570 [Nemania abortiva]|nr:hypothetical protein F5Y10DRAFT_293570 [Nemania abortiva]
MSAPQVTGSELTPTSFPQFPQLPTELRLSIWKLATEEGRTIPLIHCPPGHTQRGISVNGVPFIEVPAFFFVNWECRQLATKQYAEMTITLQIINDETRCDDISTLETHLFVKANDELVFNPAPHTWINEDGRINNPPCVVGGVSCNFTSSSVLPAKTWVDSSNLAHNWNHAHCLPHHSQGHPACSVGLYPQSLKKFDTFSLHYSHFPEKTGLDELKINIRQRFLNTQILTIA